MAKFADFFKPAYPSKAISITPARRRKLLWSYAPDWILTLVLAALFFSLDKVDGYRRVFSLEDTSLRHPYTLHERVPDSWLYIICGVVPLVSLPLINFFTVRSWWDFHNSWLGLVLGLALTGSITQFVKITVGRPRPDIVARCIPPAGAVDPPFELTDWTICTQVDVTILRDGFRSFPSGHSSMSFAGLGFLSFYLAGKMHLFDKRGHAGKAWLALTPFCAAALVAISRSMDYRHHWHDILVGSVLGVVLSFFAYRQYYPSLSSELSHRPYSPRIKDAEEEAALAAGEGVLPLHHATTASTASGSGYKAPAGGVQRYNTTPSPPPNQGYAPTGYPQQATNVPPNPFVHPNTGYSPQPHSHSSRPSQEEGYTEAEYELDGTVPRPGQGSLSNTWRKGAGGVEGSVPRSQDDDEDQEAYGGYKRDTRYQQQGRQGSGLT
ncbi:phosphatidic acid phosphatase type 2/haloperoxidase [Ephemerocybe angulata]|uniref:Phosphatidic acid phosphatase type 2/haloperoxidase n=1 Tax=Ephemerocybe angulata TaxID=980116 RepID=A0A8H6II36_9AGAR|nr:phosphatidic acid phosphatase type 2/haloperoxidase [Tulosesus angulatus]